MAAGLAALAMSGGVARAEPGALRTYLRQHYPSLTYVERYRAAYTADQTAAPPPWLAISGRAPAATYDLFATGQAGKVKLVRQPEDASWGRDQRPADPGADRRRHALQRRVRQ